MKKLLTLLLILPLLLLLGFSSPTNYISRKTGYWCIEPTRQTYAFNAIDHGKDYDALYIFTLHTADADRFTGHANATGWGFLPLDEEVLALPIASASFDPHMPEMLNASYGHWFWDGENELYVLDNDRNMLFIRTASCVTGYQQESPDSKFPAAP